MQRNPELRPPHSVQGPRLRAADRPRSLHRLFRDAWTRQPTRPGPDLAVDPFVAGDLSRILTDVRSDGHAGR
jgi:hypothetical protein